METNKIDEFSWRFQFTETASQNDIDKYIEDFVFQYVEEKGWYCGGGIEMTMYDLKGEVKISELRNGLLEYVTNNKSSILSAIVITNFDESSGEFKEQETISV